MKLSFPLSISLSAAISPVHSFGNALGRSRLAVLAPTLLVLGAAWRVPAAHAQAVDFGSVNVCPSGATSPAPCSKTLSVTFKIAASGTLGTPKVLTTGAPNLDYTLANGGTCVGAVVEGATCTVKATLAPRYAGERKGAVQIVDENGTVLATTLIHGIGVAPQIAFDPGAETAIQSVYDQFPDVEGLAVDDLDNVYLTSGDENLVYKLPADGGYPSSIGAGLVLPEGLALDGAGDVFITNRGGDFPVPGFVINARPDGSQSTVPFTGLSQPLGIAVDGSGNVFVGNYNNSNRTSSVLELPGGGGEQTALPFIGLSEAYSVAVDSVGDVFVDGNGFGQTLELPADGSGQRTFGYQGNLAVDAAGDVFFDGDYSIKQRPKGSSTQIQISFPSSTLFYTIAVNAAGDVFTHLADEPQPNPFRIIHRSQPPSLSFVATGVGATSADSPQSIQIQNIGNAPLSLSGLNVSGGFALGAGSGTPTECTASTTLAPGGRCAISISFLPDAEGPLTGTVTLSDNALNKAGSMQKIALSGTGLPLFQKLEVSATNLPFYDLPYGQSDAEPLQVYNKGTLPVTLARTINGPSFVLTRGEDYCNPVIPVGQGCTFYITFHPRTFGSHADILTLAGPEVEAPKVILTGQTIGVGSTTGVLVFGTIPYGTTAVLPLTIANYGVAGKATFSTSINEPSFKVLTTGNTCLSGVASGQQCTLPIEFSPAAVGAHGDVLTITPSSGAASTVKLSGTASQP